MQYAAGMSTSQLLSSKLEISNLSRGICISISEESEAVDAVQSTEVPERTFPNSTQIAAQLLRSLVWTFQETLFPIDGAG